jgi:hypothetical protein
MPNDSFAGTRGRTNDTLRVLRVDITSKLNSGVGQAVSDLLLRPWLYQVGHAVEIRVTHAAYVPVDLVQHLLRLWSCVSPISDVLRRLPMDGIS